MVLTEDQVIELGKLSDADSWIKEARIKSALLRMHYKGENVPNYLKLVEGLENQAQLELRKKFAISNKSLLRAQLRPVDNAFHARGGLISVDVSPENKERLFESIKKGTNERDLKSFMRNRWFDTFVYDPNGLQFNEVKTDGSYTYTTYKSIFSIRSMKVTGIQPEYVLFEPDITINDDKKKSKKEFSWLVDDAFYYRLERTMNTARIVEQIPNSFERVPAVQNSTIVDPETGGKLSPIDTQLDLLESYLIDNSINNIYKKLHGYPIFWSYLHGEKCKSCEGSGMIQGRDCKTCNGSGKTVKKDVSDAIFLKPPQSADDPIIAPNIAGYVQPSIETWQEQRTELEHLSSIISFSLWGTTFERRDNETATGRFIDAQPVNNKLNDYTDIFETIHENILKTYVDFMFTADVDVHVSYGRRFLVETPDQLWEKYQTSLEKASDQSSKDLHLSQYYESEFRSDEFMRDYYLKLMKIEPLVHYSIDEVLSMQIDQRIKDAKVLFPKWKNETHMFEIVENDLTKVIKKFEDYVNQQRMEQSLELQQN